MARYIRTWNPLREMAAMQDVLERAFAETERNGHQNYTVAGNWLALDVHENASAYLVLADIAGINPENLEVTLHEKTLSISGDVARPTLPEGTRQLHSERTYGKFRRSISLPEQVDADKVEADFENGVLRLTLPKSEASKPRQITVNSQRLASEN